MDPKKHRRVSQPIQSTATQNKLKSIKGTIERLHHEAEDLEKIKCQLIQFRNDLDSEAITFSRVTDLAFKTTGVTTKVAQQAAKEANYLDQK